MSVFCNDLQEGRAKKEIPFKLHADCRPVLKCGTVPRPTPKSLSSVKVAPKNRKEGAAERRSCAFRLGFC